MMLCRTRFNILTMCHWRNVNLGHRIAQNDLLWTVSCKSVITMDSSCRWMHSQSIARDCLLSRNRSRSTRTVADGLTGKICSWAPGRKSFKATTLGTSGDHGRGLLSRKPTYLDSLALVRHQSTAAYTPLPLTLDIGPIPDPPPIPDPEYFVSLLAGDGSLQSLGLGSCYTPSGWLQLALDLIHTHTGLPWWSVIALVTLLVRTSLVKFILKSQGKAMSMSDGSKDRLKELQDKLRNAKIRRDHVQVQILTMEATKLTREAFFGPDDGKRRFIPTALKPVLCQVTIFATFFWAIRNIAVAGFEGFVTGGTLWFVDLTQPDPTWILPGINASLIGLILFNSLRGAPWSQNYPSAVILLVPMSMVIFFVNTKFTAAVLCYWVTSSMFTLVQSLLLNHDRFRRPLNFPAYKNYYSLSKKDQRGIKGLLAASKQLIDKQREKVVLKQIDRGVSSRQTLHNSVVKPGPIRATFKTNPRLKKSEEI